MAEHRTYTCPVCSKSIMKPEDMNAVWEEMDRELQVRGGGCREPAGEGGGRGTWLYACRQPVRPRCEAPSTAVFAVYARVRFGRALPAFTRPGCSRTNTVPAVSHAVAHAVAPNPQNLIRSYAWRPDLPCCCVEQRNGRGTRPDAGVTYRYRTRCPAALCVGHGHAGRVRERDGEHPVQRLPGALQRQVPRAGAQGGREGGGGRRREEEGVQRAAREAAGRRGRRGCRQLGGCGRRSTANRPQPAPSARHRGWQGEHRPCVGSDAVYERYRSRR